MKKHRACPRNPGSISALINNWFSLRLIHIQQKISKGFMTGVQKRTNQNHSPPSGSLLVLMKTCPELWFSAWQNHISKVSMEKVSSGFLLMLPVLLWHREHPRVLSGCLPSTADSALGSFGSLSPPLPFVKCSSPGLLVYTPSSS